MISNAYEELFGQKPVGVLFAVAIRAQNPSYKPHTRPDEVSSGTGPVELSFTDDLGAHNAQIVTTDKVAQMDGSSALFNGQYGEHYEEFGASFSGSIEASSGKRIAVIVNYNMGNRFEVVDLAGGGMSHPLLKSK